MRKTNPLEHGFSEDILEFPSWRELIKISLQSYFKDRGKNGFDIDALGNGVLLRLNELKHVLQHHHPVEVLNLIAQQVPDIDEKRNTDYINTIKQKVASEWTVDNEFYVLFDLKKRDYVFVDERIRNVLGIEPEQFNIKSISALVEDCPLYHPYDLSHIMRYAILAMMCISLPCFKWSDFNVHYTARYRIGTSMSNNPQLRKKGHVVISKMCYVLNHPDDRQAAFPRYHLDRYFVYTNDEIEHPTRSFVSDFDQTILLNKLHYLFNAYLLDVPLKFICMLDERRISDRNKAVANAMNQHLMAAKGWDNEFTDTQIANCFAKTIRYKIETTMNGCDPFFRMTNKHISSDQEAVYFATRMGLLPVLENLRENIYHNIRKIF